MVSRDAAKRVELVTASPSAIESHNLSHVVANRKQASIMVANSKGAPTQAFQSNASFFFVNSAITTPTCNSSRNVERGSQSSWPRSSWQFDWKTSSRTERLIHLKDELEREQRGDYDETSSEVESSSGSSPTGAADAY